MRAYIVRNAQGDYEHPPAFSTAKARDQLKEARRDAFPPSSAAKVRVFRVELTEQVDVTEELEGA